MLVFFAAIMASIPALAGPCGMPAAGDAYEQLNHGFQALNLAKLKCLDQKNPETMKAFWAFDKAAFAPVRL